MTKKNPHLGSKFEDFLAEAGLLEDANATAQKRVLAWQIEQAMAAQTLSKTELAKRMGTSRAALDRLLDPDNASVTLQTMTRVAAALGKELEITLRGAAR